MRPSEEVTADAATFRPSKARRVVYWAFGSLYGLFGVLAFIGGLTAGDVGGSVLVLAAGALGALATGRNAVAYVACDRSGVRHRLVRTSVLPADSIVGVQIGVVRSWAPTVTLCVQRQAAKPRLLQAASGYDTRQTRERLERQAATMRHLIGLPE